VKNIESWDKAAIGKHIWSVAAKNDVFQQHGYITIIPKMNDYWIYSPPVDSCWSWKKLHKIEEEIVFVFFL